MSKILQVENLVQEFNLTKDFLDKVKFKTAIFHWKIGWFMRSTTSALMWRRARCSA